MLHVPRPRSFPARTPSPCLRARARACVIGQDILVTHVLFKTVHANNIRVKSTAGVVFLVLRRICVNNSCRPKRYVQYEQRKAPLII